MRAFAGLTAAAVLAACSAPPAPEAPTPVSEAEKAGYMPGPVLERVAAAPGGVVVHGTARAGGRVRATAASGEAYGATADQRGRFALEIPVPGGGPLFAKLSVQDGQRSTPAEGWLFSPPGDPAAATLLRPGAPALVVRRDAPLIAAVDYDAGGGAAVSGRAAAGAEVRLTVDGVASGTARADRAGRWSIRLNRVPPGAHVLRASSGGQTRERRVVLAAGSPGAGAAIVQEPDGWRVDWAPPGGGSQSTIVFTDGEQP